MADKGWIKLHRKVLDSWIWQDKPFDKARAWIDLLLLAMHHDKGLLMDGDLITIQRGSFMTSIVKLSERWGWSRNKVTRYLKLLENEQMLYTKRTPKGTLITIAKYEDYQSSDFDDEATNEPTGETASESAGETQNKNVNKNVNNETTIIVSDSSAADCKRKDIQIALDAWNELGKYGIKKVSKMKSTAVRYKMLQERINEHGIDNVLIAIENIKKSNFLQGKHKGRPWQITFDWFVRPNNFLKVFDGNYENDRNGGGGNGRSGSNDATTATDTYADNLYEQVLE